MQIYDVKVDLIPGLPKVPYQSGVGNYEGVVAHWTANGDGNGGDTPSGERDYEAETFKAAFVHYFVGIEPNNEVVILQVAPIEYTALGAGKIANQRFVHVELCNYNDEDKFRRSYDAYCFIISKTLYDRDFPISPAIADGIGTVWSHKDVSEILGGTNHDDPIDYLLSFGVTWNDFLDDVLAYYDFILEYNFDALGRVQVNGKALNIKDGPGHNYNVIAKARRGEFYKFYRKVNNYYDIGDNKFICADFCTLDVD